MKLLIIYFINVFLAKIIYAHYAKTLTIRHIIFINYDQASYICDSHNDGFKSYCEECKKDICLICEKMHIGHKIISYGVLMADKNLLKNGINELKVTIDNLKKY